MSTTRRSIRSTLTFYVIFVFALLGAAIFIEAEDDHSAVFQENAGPLNGLLTPTEKGSTHLPEVFTIVDHPASITGRMLHESSARWQVQHSHNAAQVQHSRNAAQVLHTAAQSQRPGAGLGPLGITVMRGVNAAAACKKAKAKATHACSGYQDCLTHCGWGKARWSPFHHKRKRSHMMLAVHKNRQHRSSKRHEGQDQRRHADQRKRRHKKKKISVRHAARWRTQSGQHRVTLNTHTIRAALRIKAQRIKAAHMIRPLQNIKAHRISAQKIKTQRISTAHRIRALRMAAQTHRARIHRQRRGNRKKRHKKKKKPLLPFYCKHKYRPWCSKQKRQCSKARHAVVKLCVRKSPPKKGHLSVLQEAQKPLVDTTHKSEANNSVR